MSNMNPFLLKPKKVESSLRNWKQIAQKPYDKNEADPYTKVRIILMNGTEFDANWCKHQFFRHCPDNDVRRELALLRRVEQQQQKAIASLKPINEDVLEHTIGYEQLAVDLTAIMAQNEKNQTVKKALDFALLEDFDHLYRFADVLESEQGIQGERLVGCYTEIMPGRIIDGATKDGANMGGAMAFAAADSILSYFEDTGYDPAVFDHLGTGDLGRVGSDILRHVLREKRPKAAPRHTDCGLLL